MLKLQKPLLFLAKEHFSKLFINSFFILFFSCAKMSYVTKQGWGQLKIQWSGIEYEEVLKDPKVTEEIKNKIRKIQKYKKYFYEYFKKDPTPIYSEVTFLERDVVTHLVISSLFNKVEPHKEWFPFVGEFPYLGFFEKEGAESYAREMEDDQYFTYIRPVYAYSSLGNFEDKILSTFFEFQEEELAELIFHEIFHTIFFIKDNVDLNENLANYFGKEMMYEYFNIDDKKRSERIANTKKYGMIRSELVRIIGVYKNSLSNQVLKNKEEAKIYLDKFLAEQFIPQIKEKCRSLSIEEEKCYPLKGEWNNARFAAYMTYEEKVNFIEKLHKSKQFNLKELFNYLEQKYKEYEEKGSKEKFGTWLEQQ